MAFNRIQDYWKQHQNFHKALPPSTTSGNTERQPTQSCTSCPPRAPRPLSTAQHCPANTLQPIGSFGHHCYLDVSQNKRKAAHQQPLITYLVCTKFITKSWVRQAKPLHALRFYSCADKTTPYPIRIVRSGNL